MGFEAYVEEVPAVSLRIAQLSAMDDLSTYKGVRVRGLVEARGAKLRNTSEEGGG
jgi:hypothetical protein